MRIREIFGACLLAGILIGATLALVWIAANAAEPEVYEPPAREWLTYE